jgi:HEAT repeat protein
MAVCRHLRQIGTSVSVPALKVLLLQESTSDMARYALEKIPGLVADEALTEALDKTQGKVRLGILSSLGHRRAAGAIPVLEEIMQGSDTEAAAAAAAALGHIKNPEAASALSRALKKASGALKDQIGDSLLRCAEQFLAAENEVRAAKIYQELLGSQLPLTLRQAALKGCITGSKDRAKNIILDVLKSSRKDLHSPAIGMIEETFDGSNLSEVCALFSDLPAESQVQMLGVLSRFPHKATRSCAVQAKNSTDTEVRVAALKALAHIGGAQHVALLAVCAAKARGKEQEAARRTLWRLQGEDVNKAVLLSLIKKTDTDVQAELIVAVGERRIHEGLSLLLALARSAETRIRMQAIRSLENIASPSDLPRLAELLLDTKEERDQLEAANAIAAAAGRASQPLGRAGPVIEFLSEVKEPRKRASLYRALGRIGDDSSLPELRAALVQDHPDIRDAAVRALCEWPTASPKEDLLHIARTSAGNPAHRILALRAFIRMTGMETYLSPVYVVQTLKEVTDLARPEEKKLILGVLPTFASEAALRFASSFLKDTAVEAEAKIAVEKIAEKLGKK